MKDIVVYQMFAAELKNRAVKNKLKKLLTNNWVSDKIIESLLNRATQKNIDN